MWVRSLRKQFYFKTLLVSGCAALYCLVLLPDLASSALVNRAVLRCTREFVQTGGINILFSTSQISPVGGTGYRSAFSDLETAARWNPRNTRALTWLGTLAVVQGDYGAARQQFVAGIQLNPQDQWLGFLLGVVSHALGDPDEAIEHWRKLANAEETLIGVGDRLLSQGQGRQSITYYRAAVQVNSRSPDAHLKLAEGLYALNSKDEALNHYMLAFKLDEQPRSISLAEALYHEALILSERQRYPEAIAALERAISLHPGYPIYLGTLGETYSFAGDYQQAEYWLSEAVRNVPSQGYPYWMLGRYYLRRQMVDLAVSALEQAVNATPQSPAYFYGTLGEAYMAKGDTEAAVWAFNEAVRRAPDNATYHQWLRSAQATRETDGH